MNRFDPYILAIDSSTSILRVGLSLPSGEVIARENYGRYSHAEFIFKLIDEILNSSDISKSLLKAIIISTGPGSFTGLRVGMSAAKGLAEALAIDLAGVSSFSAVAGRLSEKFGQAGVLIPSRKDEYYFGMIETTDFDDNQIKVIRGDAILSKLNNARLLGIDIDNLNIPADRIITSEEFSLKIDDFIVCGYKKLKLCGGDDISAIEPLYIQSFPVKGRDEF